jgi:hypothetical protein
MDTVSPHPKKLKKKKKLDYLAGNTSPLQKTTGYGCLGKQSLFIVWIIRNTQIHCGGRTQFQYVKAGGKSSNHWILKG